MSYSAITYTDKVENGGTTADGLVSSANLNEVKAAVNFNGADADSLVCFCKWLFKAGYRGCN